ncbi:hypothetical protein [Paenibacillus sp. HB172176]|uniref:hypothetical protein n=1 Tax=Paenibacillus sp. HB172176 TaxID=2493690 RepID=UPI00143A612F|nr:hypothetical protein [Paenibacillus sp. HB172176]
MLELLCFIIGCYSLAAVLVHLAFWLRRRGGMDEGKHYVFIADNSFMNAEWHLRKLFSFSKWMGKNVRVTVVDRGITEDAYAVLERWKRSGNELVLHREQKLDDEAGISGENSAGNHRDGAGGVGGSGMTGKTDSAQLLWVLQAEGIVTESEHAVLIDLQNPADLSKMPY